MGVKCEKCGQRTREVMPVVRAPMSQVPAMDPDRVIPRAAWAELDPEAEAACPWGQHPDDGMFQNWCPTCAGAMK